LAIEVADCRLELPIGDWNCRSSTSESASDNRNRRATTAIGERQPQSAIRNLNLQSTIETSAIGNRHSTIFHGMRKNARMPGRLSRTVVEAIDVSKIMGIRAGARADHRFTGVWPVVVEGRVFARSWTVKPGGWYRRFLADPLGTIQIGDRKVRVRAVRVRGERLCDAVEEAYATKYATPGAQKYVKGFRTKRRREATIEFVPR
jgi:hypothetical protein